MRTFFHKENEREKILETMRRVEKDKGRGNKWKMRKNMKVKPN